MEFFAVVGSGETIGRTTLSLLLAQGLLGRGLRPVFVQVLRDDEAPALAPGGSSFFTHTHRLKELGADGVALIERMSTLGDFTAAVIDLPAKAFPRRLLDAPNGHLLLPMPSRHDKLREFANDFAALRPKAAAPGGTTMGVVPVGWPAAMRPSDFEPVLAREALRGRLQFSPCARNIQSQGLSDCALAHLPAVIEGRINPAPLFDKLAARIARETLCQSGSDLIGRDPVWGICDP